MRGELLQMARAAAGERLKPAAKQSILEKMYGKMADPFTGLQASEKVC